MVKLALFVCALLAGCTIQPVVMQYHPAGTYAVPAAPVYVYPPAYGPSMWFFYHYRKK